MSGSLYIVIDTSNSIKRPAALSALQEVLEKIYEDFYRDPLDSNLAVEGLVCFKCGGDTVEFKNPGWMPEADECCGVAPIVRCLTNDVKAQLKPNSNNLLIVISDGFWAGSKSDLTEFEFDCHTRHLCALVEINIGNNTLWNFIHRNSLKISNGEDRLTRRIYEYWKNN